MIGGSGCGKTNLLLNLIYDLLPWSRLYVYFKQIDDDFQFTFDTTDI